MVYEEEIIEALKAGHIPDTLSIVHWDDITAFDNTPIGTKLGTIEIHSCGFIIGENDTHIDLQQSWDVSKLGDIDTEAANYVLRIPKGVILAVYKFKLMDGKDGHKHKKNKTKTKGKQRINRKSIRKTKK